MTAWGTITIRVMTMKNKCSFFSVRFSLICFCLICFFVFTYFLSVVDFLVCVCLKFIPGNIFAYNYSEFEILD